MLAAGLLTGRRATTHWLRHDDMAFALAGRIGGDATAQAIQLGHEYDPQPPYQAGTPAKAPRASTEALLARRDSIVA